MPEYTVISPQDSTVAYKGYSWATARTTALGLVPNVGITEKTHDATVYLAGNTLVVSAETPMKNLEVSLYSVTGQQMARWQFGSISTDLHLDLEKNLVSGIYIVRIKTENQESVTKLIKR